MEYPIDDTAGYMIYRVGRLLRVKAVNFLNKNNIMITPEQWGLLLRVHDLKTASMGDLADHALADHANITRQIAALENRGYVKKYKNPEDKRSHLVECTQAGLDLIITYIPEFIEEKEKYFEGLTRDDVAWLITALSVLESNLE